MTTLYESFLSENHQKKWQRPLLLPKVKNMLIWTGLILSEDPCVSQNMAGILEILHYKLQTWSISRKIKTQTSPAIITNYLRFLGETNLIQTGLKSVFKLHWWHFHSLFSVKKFGSHLLEWYTVCPCLRMFCLSILIWRLSDVWLTLLCQHNILDVCLFLKEQEKEKLFGLSSHGVSNFHLKSQYVLSYLFQSAPGVAGMRYSNLVTV